MALQNERRRLFAELVWWDGAQKAKGGNWYRIEAGDGGVNFQRKVEVLERLGDIVTGARQEEMKQALTMEDAVDAILSNYSYDGNHVTQCNVKLIGWFGCHGLHHSTRRDLHLVM